MQSIHNVLKPLPASYDIHTSDLGLFSSCLVSTCKVLIFATSVDSLMIIAHGWPQSHLGLLLMLWFSLHQNFFMHILTAFPYKLETSELNQQSSPWFLCRWREMRSNLHLFRLRNCERISHSRVDFYCFIISSSCNIKQDNERLFFETRGAQ